MLDIIWNAVEDDYLTVNISIPFLERPESRERIFSLLLGYVVNDLSLFRYESSESKTFPLLPEYVDRQEVL
jgi:hypothetical protein